MMEFVGFIIAVSIIALGIWWFKSKVKDVQECLKEDKKPVTTKPTTKDVKFDRLTVKELKVKLKGYKTTGLKKADLVKLAHAKFGKGK